MHHSTHTISPGVYVLFQITEEYTFHEYELKKGSVCIIYKALGDNRVLHIDFSH